MYGEDVWRGYVGRECVERMCGGEKNVFQTLGSQAKGETTARQELTPTMVGSWSVLPSPTAKLYPEKWDLITYSCSVSLTMQSHRCCDISFNVVTSSCASFNITEHSPYFSCHSETYTPQSHDSHMTVT